MGRDKEKVSPDCDTQSLRMAGFAGVGIRLHTKLKQYSYDKTVADDSSLR